MTGVKDIVVALQRKASMQLQCFTQPSLVKRGKFLKKLWYCVGGKYNEIIEFYQLG